MREVFRRLRRRWDKRGHSRLEDSVPPVVPSLVISALVQDLRQQTIIDSQSVVPSPPPVTEAPITELLEDKSKLSLKIHAATRNDDSEDNVSWADSAEPEGRQPPVATVPGPPRSFWQEARSRLGSEFQSAITLIEAEVASNDGDDSISWAERIFAAVQRQKEDMENRPGVLPVKYKDKEAKIVQRLREVLKFAKLIKDKVGDLVALDSSGSAKLAWLPLSLIIGLATVDMEQYEESLAAFTKLSHIICRYAAVENNYRKKGRSEPGFETRLVDMYKCVLECEVALVRRFCRNAFVRHLRDSIALDGWEGLVKAVTDADTECMSWIQVQQESLLLETKEVTDAIKGMAVENQEILEEIATIERKREIQDILDWIIPHDASQNRRMKVEQSLLNADYSNAGAWLLERYVSKWPSAHSTSFWLHGPVGCGKTTLTTQVIEFLLEKTLGAQDERVVYFYCSNNTGSGSSVLDVFRAMVRQLAWSARDSRIEPNIKAAWGKKEPLILQDCHRILGFLVPRYTSVVVIIDALDECGEPMMLLDELAKLPSRTKLFVSSRQSVLVQKKLVSCKAIAVTPKLAQGDLHFLIERESRKMCADGHDLGKEKNKPLLDNLISVLSERGQGAFKWSQLQLRLLIPPVNRPFNPQDFKRKLAKIQEGKSLWMQKDDELRDAYREIYEANTGYDNEDAKCHLKRALQWVFACGEGFHVQVLAHAAGIKTDPPGIGEVEPYVDSDYITKLTRDLLVVGDDGAVRLAHSSVREFFQDEPELGQEFTDVRIHSQAASSCLAYILSSHGHFDSAPPETFNLESSPDLRGCWKSFERYSLIHWPSHCARAGEDARRLNPLKPLFESLMLGERVGDAYIAWSHWVQHRIISVALVGFVPAISNPPDPFFAACRWGFPEAVQAAVRHRPYVLQARTINIEGESLSGLTVAKASNHDMIIRLFWGTEHAAEEDGRRRSPKAQLTSLMVKANITLYQEQIQRGDRRFKTLPDLEERRAEVQRVIDLNTQMIQQGKLVRNHLLASKGIASCHTVGAGNRGLKDRGGSLRRRRRLRV